MLLILSSIGSQHDLGVWEDPYDHLWAHKFSIPNNEQDINMSSMQMMMGMIWIC